ncbi:MAG TPA: hypothetical protein VI728_13270 [Syntrophales bacterium]|nr:hypothetical protein [Syntrophales bacterium]
MYNKESQDFMNFMAMVTKEEHVKRAIDQCLALPKMQESLRGWKEESSGVALPEKTLDVICACLMVYFRHQAATLPQGVFHAIVGPLLDSVAASLAVHGMLDGAKRPVTLDYVLGAPESTQ